MTWGKITVTKLVEMDPCIEQNRNVWDQNTHSLAAAFFVCKSHATSVTVKECKCKTHSYQLFGGEVITEFGVSPVAP